MHEPRLDRNQDARSRMLDELTISMKHHHQVLRVRRRVLMTSCVLLAACGLLVTIVLAPRGPVPVNPVPGSIGPTISSVPVAPEVVGDPSPQIQITRITSGPGSLDSVSRIGSSHSVFMIDATAHSHVRLTTLQFDAQDSQVRVMGQLCFLDELIAAGLSPSYAWTDLEQVKSLF
ncbi:MAG: hypothetical protein CMJ32_01075 [Phycisphaerae bacterium]|nr:hypothetical protein [Phycisphaerae bacterium]